ncbi:MAG: transporter [Halopseudomonas sp.]|uniref:transporter n=1 Tax=Halopseudomonas sp. TaxID=2901191 RepID=UPI003003229F
MNSPAITRTGILAALAVSAPLSAAQNNAELAKSLSNPVAALISVPFQYNYDENIGPDDDGHRSTLNIQPVVPISISEDWNMISRTILPVISQSDVAPGAGSQSGLGDVVQSLFFSPKDPTASGWIWGVGPAFLLPTGSKDELTADKWGAGPTGVVLRQQGPWTYGGLFNHLVDVAGDDDRSDINSTFLQPFVSYTTPTAVSYTLNSETTLDWENDDSAVPINAIVSKVIPIAGHPYSFGGGLRYWAKSTDNGPEGLGLRLQVTALFPK